VRRRDRQIVFAIYGQPAQDEDAILPDRRSLTPVA